MLQWHANMRYEPIKRKCTFTKFGAIEIAPVSDNVDCFNASNLSKLNDTLPHNASSTILDNSIPYFMKQMRKLSEKTLKKHFLDKANSTWMKIHKVLKHSQ